MPICIYCMKHEILREEIEIICIKQHARKLKIILITIEGFFSEREKFVGNIVTFEDFFKHLNRYLVTE